MNILNTISYDSTYSKSDSSQLEIKQSIPAVMDNSYFSQKTDYISKVGSLDRKEKSSDIEEAVDKSNASLQAFDRKLEMSVHKKTREVMVKVIDTVTDEVIREIPPEKVLDTIASRKEMLGILMDKKI